MSYLCVNVLVVESLNGLVDYCFSREEQGSAVLMSSGTPPLRHGSWISADALIGEGTGPGNHSGLSLDVLFPSEA